MISTEILARAFQEFRDNNSYHLTVNVRRMRAEQPRKLLSNPDTVDLDFFNREVWVYESVTKINGEKISGFSDATVEPSKIAIVKRALSDSRLELHGNYTWGSGTCRQQNQSVLTYVATSLKTRFPTSLLPPKPLNPCSKRCY